MGFLKKLFGGEERSTPPVEESGSHDPALRKAVEQVSAHPSDRTRQELYDRLRQGTLLVAVQSLPEGIGMTPQTLTQDMSVTMLTSTAPDGGVVLLAFTDEAALHQRIPACPYLALPARQVLDIVLRDGYAGLVINPAGRWADVPRADIQRIVDGAYK